MNLRAFIARLLHPIDRRGKAGTFDDEVEAHLRLLAARFQAEGMSPDEAAHAARRQFGNIGALRETRNQMQTIVWIETLWRDLQFGLRMLVRNKGFSTVAVLTLALGIGANTAIFSVVNAAMLRPLPYPDAGRLVVLWGNVQRERVERRGACYPDYLDWRTQSRSFQAMAAFEPHQFVRTGIDTPERLSGEYVSQPYFSLLGIHAVPGRTFRPDEDRVAQRDPVAVLSDGAWRRRFGADPAIIGRTIQLDGRPYTIVGIAPPQFRGLTDEAEVWVPFVMSGTAEELADRGTRSFLVVGRLKSGVSLAQAQTEMNAISARLAAAYPRTNEARGVELSPLQREVVGDLRKPLLVLLCAVGFVLLIASVNVANLLLARSDARQQEMGMRTALGASRGRLIRQLLAESAVLVACGCAAGLALAHFGIRALMTASPVKFPSFVHPAIDPSVCLFTVAVCAVITVALGLTPAAQAAARDEVLRQGVGRSIGTRRGSRFREALVVAEISVSLMLLIGAGLMIRSLRHLATISPGYQPEDVAAIRVTLPDTAINASEILRRLAAMPSIESASVATEIPLTDGAAVFYTAEGQPPMNAQSVPRAYLHGVTPDFFRTLRIPLLFGRTFSGDDLHTNPNVAIVTRSMTDRFWPGQNPIGKRIRIGRVDSRRPWLSIIGVVPDLKYRGIPQNPTADPDLFQLFDERSRDFALLVRTSVDPGATLQALPTALRQMEPSILTYDAETLHQVLTEAMSPPRFVGSLLAIFAALALTLAMIGVYGVIAYSVSRRTREIGLRVALGASRPMVIGMVVGGGIVPVVVGIGLGSIAALALTRTMATLIYEVTPSDPLTFITAAALLASVALLACVVPARRATRIDPAIALRNE